MNRSVFGWLCGLISVAALMTTGCTKSQWTLRTDPSKPSEASSVRTYPEVIEESPNVKSVSRVTDNKDSSLELSQPTLSPQEDVLLYCIYEREQNEVVVSNIWRQDVEGFSRTRLTFGRSLNLFPTLTGDGVEMVFSSNRAGSSFVLWRVNLRVPTGITKITNSSDNDYAPSVSPDGAKVAYMSIAKSVDTERHIWTVNMAGNLPTHLREGETPQVSHDGKRILFVRRDKKSGRGQVWTMDLNGGGETQLTENIAHDVAEPKWSPKDDWIVFASDEGLDKNKHQNYDIWIMRANGSQKTQLTTNGSCDDGPCFDRTGKYIYFRSNRGLCWNIWRFEPVLAGKPEETQPK